MDAIGLAYLGAGIGSGLVAIGAGLGIGKLTAAATEADDNANSSASSEDSFLVNLLAISFINMSDYI